MTARHCRQATADGNNAGESVYSRRSSIKSSAGRQTRAHSPPHLKAKTETEKGSPALEDLLSIWVTWMQNKKLMPDVDVGHFPRCTRMTLSSVKLAHDNAHVGQQRPLELLTRKVFWLPMRQYIYIYKLSCGGHYQSQELATATLQYSQIRHGQCCRLRD